MDKFPWSLTCPNLALVEFLYTLTCPKLAVVKFQLTLTCPNLGVRLAQPCPSQSFWLSKVQLVTMPCSCQHKRQESLGSQYTWKGDSIGDSELVQFLTNFSNVWFRWTTCCLNLEFPKGVATSIIFIFAVLFAFTSYKRHSDQHTKTNLNRFKVKSKSAPKQNFQSFDFEILLRGGLAVYLKSV